MKLWDEYGKKTIYESFLESEGIDVITGYGVDDVRTLPLKHWKRMGGLGVYLRLEGADDTNNAYVAEIPAKEALHPERHLFEEMIFILSGSGATELWNEGGQKQIFEWQEGSLFSIPINAWHRLYNTKDRPVRLIAVTDLPPVIELFHNLDFVFNNDFVFRDRYNGEGDYFSGKGTLNLDRYWSTNFVPNIHTFKLLDFKARGGGGTNVKFNMAGGVMEAHVSEYKVGKYKKGHRHGAGAHVITLNGEGYTLLWKGDEPKQRFDWHKGSLLVPPRMVFHQHFNTSSEPARYLALRWGSWKYRVSCKAFGGENQMSSVSTRLGGDQIEYEDEDPMIRELFETELAKRGVQSQMPIFKK